MADGCQVQVWIDADYKNGVTQLKSLLERVAPQCTALDTLTGMVSQIDNYIAGFIRGDAWDIEKWRHEYSELMAMSERHARDRNRMESALRKVAQLADTGSELHRSEFMPHGEGDGVPPGWRVVERMRQVACDAITETCAVCSGEGQVQLTDEGGNRSWWACPACR